jgi:LPS export ABC transporter protein LptC
VIYRIFAFLTIVAVIALSLLLSGQQSGTPASTAVQQTGWEEGYSAKNAKLVQTGAGGAPLYTLNAATIRQLPNEGQVQLTQVELSFRDPDGNLWTATSDRGELEQRTQQVSLAGNVHVSGTLSGVSGPAQISTAALSVDIRNNVVSTRDPVQMLWSGRQESAVGLTANLKDHRVDLESAVHGTFTQ